MRTFILVLSLVASSAWGASGGMDGGGGQGILCETARGHRTLRSLDLYEAEAIWGYSIPATATSAALEFRRIFPNYQLFSDSFGAQRGTPPPLQPPEQIDRYFSVFRKEFDDRLLAIPKGSHLNLSRDGGDPILQPPPRCKLVQVLFYADENYDAGKILVDRTYWNRLSPQDQVAFLLHEYIYKQERAWGAKDSRNVRKVVGLLFQNRPFPGKFVSTYRMEHLRFCSAKGKEGDPDSSIGFFLVPYYLEGKAYARLVFDQLGDSAYPMVETTLDSIWNYEKWIHDEPFDTSGLLSWTKSALGSRRVWLSFTDKECLNKNQKCLPAIWLQDKQGNWAGGELSCEDFR